MDKQIQKLFEYWNILDSFKNNDLKTKNYMVMYSIVKTTRNSINLIQKNDIKAKKWKTIGFNIYIDNYWNKMNGIVMVFGRKYDQCIYN